MLRSPSRLTLVLPALFAAPLACTDEEVQGYLRFVPEGQHAGRLETAVATFEGPRGLKVHLVAAVHVGDRAYYQGLEKLFEGQDALLYEMVKSEDFEPGERSGGMVSAFQRALKDVLGLEFQLDAIDYTRENFVHADMDAETFLRMQRERGESLLTLMFRAILDDLNRQSRGDASAELNGFQLLAAFLSKDRARALKLLLARQFNEIESRLAGLSGEKGTVILTERNKVAVKVLKKTIASGKKEIGVFYGALHMPDLERRLKEELKLKKKGTRWLTAWDISQPKPPPPAPPAGEEAEKAEAVKEEAPPPPSRPGKDR